MIYKNCKVLGCLLTVFSFVKGHGMLLDPPGRSSLWRFKEFTDKYPSIQANYDDNELYCGGYAVQHNKNEGMCGVCGDDFSQPEPRDNEAGGKYGTGLIVRRYTPGSKINVFVNLTTTHKGYMEFRICPHNNPRKPINQTCLDKYVLETLDGSTKVKVQDGEYTNGVKIHKEYNITLQLPQGLTCSHCVMQWHYRTGNTWHICEDGINFNCGPQETFINCADVAIEEQNKCRPSSSNRPRPPCPTKRPKKYNNNNNNRRV